METLSDLFKNKIFIPIGVQCNSSVLLQRNNIKYKSLPFDFCFTHPKFIYELFLAIYNNNFEVNEEILSYFFGTKVEKSIETEYVRYITSEQGHYVNVDSTIIFPHHDLFNEDVKNAFIRRLNRLCDVLKNNNFILFHISSPNYNGKLRYNGDIVNCYDDALYLNKLFDLISNGNNNMVVISYNNLLLKNGIIFQKIEEYCDWEKQIQNIDLSNILNRIQH